MNGDKEEFEKEMAGVITKVQQERIRQENEMRMFPVYFFAIVFLVMATLFGPVIISAFTSHYDYYIIESTQPIASLGDSSGTTGEIHGGLFVISGYISDTKYFDYYEKTGNKTFKPGRVPAAISIIVTDDPASPYLLTRNHYQIHHTWFTDNGFGSPARELIGPDYEFHVPDGSVVEKYNLDTNMNT